MNGHGGQSEQAKVLERLSADVAERDHELTRQHTSYIEIGRDGGQCRRGAFALDVSFSDWGTSSKTTVRPSVTDVRALVLDNLVGEALAEVVGLGRKGLRSSLTARVWLRSISETLMALPRPLPFASVTNAQLRGFPHGLLKPTFTTPHPPK